MPYITRTRRPELDRVIAQLPRLEAGDLAYVLYRIVQDCHHMAQSRGFQCLSGLLGILEAVKLEFYRREVAPYEDDKIRENGDVG